MKPGLRRIRRRRAIDLADTVLDERKQEPGIQLEDVVGGAREHVRDGADPAPLLVHDLHPDQVGHVVRVGGKGGQLVPSDRELGAAGDRRGRA